MSYDEVAEQQLRSSIIDFYPQLSQSKVIDRRVGHRPGRVNSIRLETEYLEAYDQWLFHNYGHAGGGLTLAPGCGQDIVDQIQRF